MLRKFVVFSAAPLLVLRAPAVSARLLRGGNGGEWQLARSLEAMASAPPVEAAPLSMAAEMVRSVEWRFWGPSPPSPTDFVRAGLVSFTRRAREQHEHRGGWVEGAAGFLGQQEVDYMTVYLHSFVSMAVWLVLVLLVACCYRRSHYDGPLDEDAKEAFRGMGFKHGPFSCFEEPTICFWSCCCGGIRWADTMEKADILTFWTALAVFLALTVLDVFTGGITLWIVAALIFTYFRQQLRRALRMHNQNEDVLREEMLKDFALWCCCACCAIAQEARQVEDAKLKALDNDEKGLAPSLRRQPPPPGPVRQSSAVQ